MHNNYDLKSYSNIIRVFFLLPILLLSTSNSWAIIIRHDMSDQTYIVDSAQYPAIFYLSLQHQRKTCVATLIKPRWAITAAHCLQQTPVDEQINLGHGYSVTIGTQKNKISKLVYHPKYYSKNIVDNVDLALIQLQHPVNKITPIKLYQQADETGKKVIILGWGGIGKRLDRRPVQ